MDQGVQFNGVYAPIEGEDGSGNGDCGKRMWTGDYTQTHNNGDPWMKGSFYIGAWNGPWTIWTNGVPERYLYRLGQCVKKIE